MEAIIGLKAGEVVYQNDVAQKLERMECLIPQLNESVSSVSCVRHDYSVV